MSCGLFFALLCSVGKQKIAMGFCILSPAFSSGKFLRAQNTFSPKSGVFHAGVTVKVFAPLSKKTSNSGRDDIIQKLRPQAMNL